MSLRLGEFAHLVGERQRFAEVFEFIFLFQVLLVHNLPAAVQFAGQLRECFAFQRRHPALALYTFLFS